MQSGEFLRSLLRPLIKVGLPLMKNILKPLNKNKILSIPLGLTAAAAALAQIHKKSYCLRNKDTNNIK